MNYAAPKVMLSSEFGLAFLQTYVNKVRGSLVLELDAWEDTMLQKTAFINILIKTTRTCIH